ncbi:MAG TPA: hypothetical protein VH021_07005 [Trebonia sp.]|nr:hypothetical protein [Trebonia sp.]
MAALLGVAATFASRRVASLTAAAHEGPHLILAARITVFHDGFAAGAAFAAVALLISATLLPPPPRADGVVAV